MFSENQFCSLSVWDLLRLTPGVFCSYIFTRRSSLWLLSFGWDLRSDSSHKIGNKYFIDHWQGWKEGSFVCETVWFFSWVNTHSFDWKFVAFYTKFSGDSYLLFQEITSSREFLKKFRANQGYPLPKFVWNSTLLSAIFILRPYCVENIHVSTFICTLHPGKEACS